MNDLSLSRRAVARGLALLPAVAVSSIAVASSAATEGDTAMNMMTKISSDADHSAWDTAMSRYLRATSASRAADDHLTKLYKRLHSTLREPEMDQIKKVIGRPGESDGHILHSANLEKRYQLYVEGHGKWWWSHQPEVEIAQFRAACDVVLKFRAERERLEGKLGIKEAEALAEAAVEEEYAADSALMDMKAPHGDAFLWKLERVIGSQTRDPDGFGTAWHARLLDPVLHDARELLARKAA